MSMREYSLNDVGLLITPELAFRIIALDEQHDGTLPPEIEEMLKNPNAINPKDIPKEYLNVDIAHEILQSLDIDTVYCTQFTGEAEPANLPGYTNASDSRDFDDEFIAYVPTDNPPGLFSTAYTNPDKLIKEFKDKLRDIIPDDVDIKALIYNIRGTYIA